MQKYRIKWTQDLNKTELEILLEEWRGFFKIEEVA